MAALPSFRTSIRSAIPVRVKSPSTNLPLISRYEAVIACRRSRSNSTTPRAAPAKRGRHNASAAAGVPAAALALWRPRFAGAARGVVEFERERRHAITASYLEIKGKLVLGDFTLTGIADRIDVLKDGKAAILDYKTG